MLPLTASTATAPRSNSNLWLSSLYAGVITAILGFLFVTFFRQENPPLYLIALLLIGIGPVIGYALASGRWSIPGIIGGLIGSIFLSLLLVGALGWALGIAVQGTAAGTVGGIAIVTLASLLWGLFVGLFHKAQSVGKLIGGSILGAILAGIVFLLVATAMGQDPSWLGTGIILLVAVWGGTVGAAMSAWEK